MSYHGLRLKCPSLISTESVKQNKTGFLYVVQVPWFTYKPYPYGGESGITTFTDTVTTSITDTVIIII